MSNLVVDADRLWSDIMALANITEPGRPFTRRAFSSLYLDGRALVADRMRAAGLAVRLDPAGNLIGRREGRRADLGTLVIGSHTDTVPEGGRFDGIAGVVTGLEIARVLSERGIKLDHAFEVYDCLAEEVSPHGLSCVGSRAVAGALSESLLARMDPSGETLAASMVRMGATPHDLSGVQRTDIAAYLELHIEQGPVLEAENIDIGIVTAISGVTRVEIATTGRADHAGTAPMHLRADALVAAADLIRAVRTAATARIRPDGPHFVATVGEAHVAPNAANVVPSSVSLLVDIRAEDRADLAAFLAALDEPLEAIPGDHPGVTVALHPVSDNPPAPADTALQADFAAAAADLGLTARSMASGAGHDMAWFARIAPAAMVFVPSRGGHSHTPDEWTDKPALAKGAAVMLDALLRADRRLTLAAKLDTGAA
jgi:N-carbamoyl-L-amino-acid hydrolase